MRILIASTAGPKSLEAFPALCAEMQKFAVDYDCMILHKPGIILTQGAGCWNYAMEIQGQEEKVELILRPIGAKGCRKHRVFVECPGCHKEVPAGRVHQHVCR